MPADSAKSPSSTKAATAGKRSRPAKRAPRRAITLPRTLGELRAAGYTERPVKDEMRDNLVRMLQDGAAITDLFPGIIGFEKTVLPGLVNAILSRHDFILLGLRGQAKTRILRSLVRFLDEHLPAIDGTDLNENPFAPITAQGRRLLAEHGDETPLRWLERDERYQEKLATPDVTIADLIGDVDPIKAATQRLSYADQGVIHYGIVPRTNRGIFAINEVPDLPPRIQVGLLNILEEKDFQVRGFPLRIPAGPVHGVLGQPRGLHQPRQHHLAAQGPHRLSDHHPLPVGYGARPGDYPPGGVGGPHRRRYRRGARLLSPS